MIRRFYRMLIPTLFHYHVNSARSNHLLHFNSTTDGIEDGAQYKAVALFHVQACKLLVAVWNLSK